jgi:hypothetical protein
MFENSLGLLGNPGLISCKSISYKTVIRNVACHGYQLSGTEGEDGSVLNLKNTRFPRYRGKLQQLEDGSWEFRAEKII